MSEFIKMETEASKFAMELLMPEHLLRKSFKEHGEPLINSGNVRIMARQFKVDYEIMVIRLAQIGLFRY